MSLRSRLPSGRLPFGMGTVALILSVLLVVTAGLVMWGSPDDGYGDEDGALRAYDAEPATAWTVDDTNLKGFTGDGTITVADHSGDDWLVAYPSGFGRSFQLVDVKTGKQLWSQPIRVGLGDCAFNRSGELGCAVKLGQVANGFYLVDPDDGSMRKTDELRDTVSVTGVGDDFLRVNQIGYQAALRDPEGRLVWDRTFAATATPELRDGVLTVTTADGSSYVLDQRTGDDQLGCTDCELGVYRSGVTVMRTEIDRESVAVHPRTGDDVGRAVRTAAGLEVVAGQSTLPVLTGAGARQMQVSDGHYEIVDPATGAARWQISDPQLSKVHARPCGATVNFARKDRSRVFFDLASGDRLGEMPAPDIDTPDRNLDYLSCVGSSGDDVVVYASRDQLTAFHAHSGNVAWELPIDGTAADVDGYLVLTQGTSLSVLRAG
ncbi:MAG: PQQ-binding-like beta-propeller repeat protein [Gordonia sp. (in: high G+C Gram-positive bacteria)]